MRLFRKAFIHLGHVMRKRHKRRVWPCREQERVCHPCEEVSSLSRGFAVQHLEREGWRTQNQKDQSDGTECCRPAKHLGEERKKPSVLSYREGERDTKAGRVDFPRRPWPGRLARLDTCHFLFTGLCFSVTTIYLNADVMSSARTNPERLRPRHLDSSAASRDLIGLK